MPQSSDFDVWARGGDSDADSEAIQALVQQQEESERSESIDHLIAMQKETAEKHRRFMNGAYIFTVVTAISVVALTVEMVLTNRRVNQKTEAAQLNIDSERASRFRDLNTVGSELGRLRGELAKAEERLRQINNKKFFEGVDTDNLRKTVQDLRARIIRLETEIKILRGILPKPKHDFKDRDRKRTA